MTWLKQVLFGNLLLKLAALVTSCAIWLYVDSLVSETKTLSVQVALVAPEGTSVSVKGGEPLEADLRIRGPVDTVRLLTAQHVTARLSVPAEAADGEIVLQLGADDFHLPELQDLTIVGVQPAQVTVTVDRE